MLCCFQCFVNFLSEFTDNFVVQSTILRSMMFRYLWICIFFAFCENALSSPEKKPEGVVIGENVKKAEPTIALKPPDANVSGRGMEPVALHLTMGASFQTTFACISDDSYFKDSVLNLSVIVVNPNTVRVSVYIYIVGGYYFPVQYVNASSNARFNINAWHGNCSPDQRVNGTGIYIYIDGLTSVYASLESEDGRVASQFLILPRYTVGWKYSPTPCGRTVFVPDPGNAAMISAVPFDPSPYTWLQNPTNVTLPNYYYTFYSKSSFQYQYTTYSAGPAQAYHSIATCRGSTFDQLPSNLADREFAFMTPPNVTGLVTVQIYMSQAPKEDTFLLINGIDYGPFPENSSMQLSLQANNGCLISSNNEIEVYYGGGEPYLYGQVYPEALFAHSNVSFVPLTQSSFNGTQPRHMLRIVVPHYNETASITLDGQLISALKFRHIPNTVHYYYYDTMISNEQHSIGVTKERIAFLATVYAFPAHSQQPMASFVVALDLPYQYT